MRKEFLVHVKGYEKDTILTPVFVLLEVLMEVLIPLVMAKIIDVGVKNGDLNYIVKTGLLLVVMAFVALFFGAMAGRKAALAGGGFGKNLRMHMFEHIQEFSFENIDKFSTSSLVTRLTTDVMNIRYAFMMMIRMMARAPFMLILSWIMTYRINAKIATLFLIMMPILGGMLMLIAKKAHPYFIQAYETYDSLNNRVEENVNAQRVVKAYVREDYEEKKFRKVSQKIYDIYTKAEKIVAWNGPLMRFTVYSVILLIILLGGKAIVRTDMEIGQLTSIMIYAMQVMGSLMTVTFMFIIDMVAQASRERVREVLDEVPSMDKNEDGIKQVKDGSVEFEDVCFSYGGDEGNLALNDINLKIESGQTIGIIGGTGSSKSTLVQLIPRLYDVNRGSVKVGGVDVRDYNLQALRDEVSMVLQNNVLFTGSIYENVRWGDPDASDEEVIRACKLAQADEFIQGFPDKYNSMVVEAGNNLSGGQKQRLTIARALLNKPKILILDDSTSAVDTKTESFIQDAFREEIPDTTKIIIAQRISSVEDADQIIVMDEGRIVGQGTSQELLESNKIYREVYESQKKGGGHEE